MSNPFLINDLAKELVRKQPSTVTFGSAEVDAVNASPPTVDLLFSGSTIINVRYLDSYTPTVGDRVVIARMGRAWFVIGKLA